MYLHFIPHTTFSSIFLHAVSFLYVLHFNVIRRQIEIETESLMYGYNAGPPMAIPIYTVLLYCVIHNYMYIQCTCMHKLTLQ